MRIITSRTSESSRTERGRAGRAGSAVFSLDLPKDAPRAERAPAPVALAPLDALLSLQEEAGHKERKKRGVRRGRAMIDALDGLRVALLSGAIGPEAANRLQAAMAEAAPTGDPALDPILEAIELRAAVELAKLRRAAAKARG